MPNNTKSEVAKTSHKYAKTRGEHCKDIIIAILIAGIISFIAGMHFANQHTTDTAQAVKSATAQATAVKK
jgi:gas vesicle protein